MNVCIEYRDRAHQHDAVANGTWPELELDFIAKYCELNLQLATISWL